MSKHKHFHRIRTPQQMLQHGRREGIGPLCRPASKVPTARDKETPASSAKADGGKGTQQSN